MNREMSEEISVGKTFSLSLLGHWTFAPWQQAFVDGYPFFHITLPAFNQLISNFVVMLWTDLREGTMRKIVSRSLQTWKVRNRKFCEFSNFRCDILGRTFGPEFSNSCCTDVLTTFFFWRFSLFFLMRIFEPQHRSQAYV